ncbi:MAG: hypothetical protein ACYS9X_17425 [Planctomycetota bacterium]|jgi:hypothetical protein
MRRLRTVAAAGVALAALLCCTARAETRTGSTMQIDAEVTDGAGDVVTSTSYSMAFSVSQTQVGEVKNATYKLDIGFIAAAPPNTGPGDLDGNGFVEWDDVLIIMANAGLNSTHLSWDPRCDTDDNGVCNLDDLMKVFRNYGAEY